MSNKPELDWNGIGWDDAMVGSVCRAYNYNGNWNWYSSVPSPGSGLWVGVPNTHWQRGGRATMKVDNWYATLEMRPEAAKKPQPLLLAKLIGAAASAGLIDVEDMPDDAAAALAYFVELNDTAAQMADYYNRVERATMAIIESLEAGRDG